MNFCKARNIIGNHQHERYKGYQRQQRGVSQPGSDDGVLLRCARALGERRQDLADCAADVLAMPDIETTALKVLTGLLRKRTNEPRPAAAGPGGQPPDTWSQQWSLLTTRGPAGGANEAAKQAWFDTRKTRKFDTETNAKFAFRDAYLARTATPAEASA